MEYRRLVASVATKLSLEEVQKVAFIRLENRNVTTGIDLLARLECSGHFSQDNIDDLMEIFVKDINRKDLAKEVKLYKKNPKQIEKPRKRKTSAPPAAPTSNSERQELENTYALVVSMLDELERQISTLQGTLTGGNDRQNEAAEIVYLIGEAAQTLAKDAYDAYIKLTHRSCADSSISVHSLNIEHGSTRSDYENPAFRQRVQSLGEPLPLLPFHEESRPSSSQKEWSRTTPKRKNSSSRPASTLLRHTPLEDVVARQKPRELILVHGQCYCCYPCYCYWLLDV